jgi:allantoinase
MPLNSIPPTVDPGALEVKRASARDQIVIDVGFWGGAVPGSLGHLAALWDRGVYGFKCFLLPSGVEEFPPLDLPQLDRVMAEVAGFGGLLVVHAEDAATIAAAPTATGDRYADFLSSRPAEAEDRAIAVVIDRAAAHGTRVHVLHLSSAGSLDQISRARAAGVRLTAETCPHYLTIDAAQIGTGQTAFKCCPPIRDAANCDRLWSGLRDGTIDCVVTDHSPSPPALKALDRGDFGDAWGGISSLQLGLPLVWTAGRRRGHDLGDLVGWMARRPAEVAGLRGKGRIAPGFDGDFSVFAPDETFTVDPAQLHHRHPVTPYAGRRLTGVVRSTWLRGECVRADRPTGQLLTREEPDDS